MQRDMVLVVDDDPDFRQLMRTVIEPLGPEVVEAADLREALKIVDRMGDRLSLVLLDYFLPGMTSERCEKLRSAVGERYIVLCTAAWNPAERAAELGLHRWLPKPFEIATVESLVRKATADAA